MIPRRARTTRGLVLCPQAFEQRRQQGKKSYPRRATKGLEEAQEDLPRIAKGTRDIHEGQEGEKISPRRNSKRLEKT